MSYPIHITNIYELLNEDGAPVQKQAPAKDTKTQAKVPAKGTSGAKPQGASGSQAQQAPKPQQGGQGGQRGGRGGLRPPRSDRPPRDSGEAATIQPRKEGGERRDDRRERRERGGGGDYSVGSKRVFDRRSGTGRGKEFKKGGAGRGNWGSSTDEQVNNEQPIEKKEGEVETPAQEGGATKEGEQPQAEVPQEEEEDKTLTLDQYLAQKASKKFSIETREVRKANEGVDAEQLKKWQNYAPLKRDDEIPKPASATESSPATEKKEKKAPKKQVVPVDQFFDVKAPPREDFGRGRGRGRGGRGGSRGGNRGAPRGGRGGSTRGGNSEIKLDESSFPSLKA